MAFKAKQASRYGAKSNMATSDRLNSQANMTTKPLRSTEPSRGAGTDKNIEQGVKTIPLGTKGKGSLVKGSDGKYSLVGKKGASVADTESLKKQYEGYKKKYPNKFNK